MQVHEAIVAVLRDVGVDVIFGGAGEESMGMQIAVARAEGVRGIIPKHEQNASFMACGYALFRRAMTSGRSGPTLKELTQKLVGRIFGLQPETGGKCIGADRPASAINGRLYDRDIFGKDS